MLRRFVMMVLCVKMVSVRRVRVMGGLCVIAGFVMLRGFGVVVRGVLAVFRRVLVMLGCGRVGHDRFPPTF
jgi:hypothetical protein